MSNVDEYFSHQTELETLRERVLELETGYKEAIEDIEDWGQYASDYFQNKHDLDGTVRAHWRILKQEKDDE